MTWLFLLIWDPISSLDLRNADGEPDHAKLLPAIVLFWLLALATWGRLPSLGHTLAIVSCSFGYAGWRTFLRSRVVTATEITGITEAIVHDRDEQLGIQPTP